MMTNNEMNPSLKMLLTPRNPDYLRIDLEFRILETSYGVARFSHSPESIECGADVRHSFPELIGLEDIAREIGQGVRTNFELKSISREVDSMQSLYFDLHLLGDLGNLPNALIIVILDVTEEVEAKRELSQVANEYSLLNENLAVENRKLEALTNVDGLTDLGNRRAFDNYLDRQWQQLQRKQLPLALILCDIDHFKQYNDTYGHIGGDECLRQVAGILRSIPRRGSDFSARYGGEEFALILPETDGEGGLKVANRIRHELARLNIPHQSSPTSGWVTMSCGIASMIPYQNGKPQDLIAQADQALYEGKQQGRDRAVLFGS